MADNKTKKSEMTGQIRQELKDLTSSISKMMGVFKQIRKPIQESFETVPTTAEHLEKVTEQTEQATNKVLDMVEAITNRESESTEWLKKMKEIISKADFGKKSKLGKLLDELTTNAEANLNDSYSIMDALQFQDITSQQIDHAITLLDDVEDKLMSLLKTVGVKKEGRKSFKNNKKKRVYDPNANFHFDDNNQQDAIDSIISDIE